MSLMTSPVGLMARSIARSIGLNKLMINRRHATGYEQDLTNAMRAATRLGDIVWDVGANVGFYSQKFADWTGSDGHVYAFEPEPATLGELRAGLQNRMNVSVIPVGLSDADGRLPFKRLEMYDNGALVVDAADAQEFLEVRAGDNLSEPPPNVLKVDVEGHELSVLTGMQQHLKSPGLHDVFIELHFAMFSARGQNDTPGKIERLLKTSGFALRWIGASHLHARR